MKKIIKILIGAGATTVLMFSLYGTAYALNVDYVPLAPLPCIGQSGTNCPTTNTSNTTTFQDYIPSAFNLAIGIAAVLAFIMITFGGVMYATSDAITGKSAGKQHIEDAIWGLLLVLGAWIILWTINPNILKFELNPQQIKIEATTPAATAGVKMTDVQIAASNAIATELGQVSNPCAQGQTTNCVNYDGMKDTTIAGVKNLQSACTNCTIVITGGTEPGHSIGSAHLNGTAVDIRSDPNLNTFIMNNSRSLSKGILVPCGTYVYGTGTYLWEPKGSTCGGTVSSSGDHWHVGF